MQALVDIVAAIVLALAAAAFAHFGVSFEQGEKRPAAERSREVERQQRKAAPDSHTLLVSAQADRPEHPCPEAAFRA